MSIPGAESRDEWRAKAQRAEAAGFDTLLVADHLVDGVFSSLAALVAAAEATERLRVGTLVLDNDFRHPVLLAREAAVVDLLTDGRLELGIGAGHMKWEYDQAGLTFDPPAVRVARMTEAVEIIRRLLDGEEVTFAGDHYRVNGHRCYPRPSGHIPLFVGGNGRRVLSCAARFADIIGFTGFSQVEGARDVNPTHFTDAGLAAQVDWVRASAGQRFDQLELSTLIQGITITGDRRGVAAEVQPLVPALSVDDVLQSPYSLIGTQQEIADQLRHHREHLGITYITVLEKDLDTMAEIIGLLR